MKCVFVFAIACVDAKDVPDYLDEMTKATMADPLQRTKDLGNMLKDVKAENAWRGAPWYANDPASVKMMQVRRSDDTEVRKDYPEYVDEMTKATMVVPDQK